jgi:hypothetical protein
MDMTMDLDVDMGRRRRWIKDVSPRMMILILQATNVAEIEGVDPPRTMTGGEMGFARRVSAPMQTEEAGRMGMRRRRSRNMSLGNIIEMIDSLPRRRTKLGMNEKEEAGYHMDTADIQAWNSSITKQETEKETG